MTLEENDFSPSAFTGLNKYLKVYSGTIQKNAFWEMQSPASPQQCAKPGVEGGSGDGKLPTGNPNEETQNPISHCVSPL